MSGATGWGVIAVILLIAFAVALGVAVSAQERALRKGSARAADAFDLVVGAPGSQTQLVLTTVYLQPAALDLIDGSLLKVLQAEPGAAYVSPIAFGDFHQGSPVVGATAEFLTQAGRVAPAEGRVFARGWEAVVGAAVRLKPGDRFKPAHGRADADEQGHVHEHAEYTVVGRMPATGTPWDRAIIVPVESVWEVHGLGSGHVGDEHEDHADGVVGAPWDAENVPGVPAIVVKPKTVADAYRLRTKYRSATTMALFPAEVLVGLYAALGDARSVLAAVAVGTQGLVIGAVLLAVFAAMRQRQRQLAVLRALGASRGYVFLAVWSHVTLMVAAGALLGLALGEAGAYLLSAVFRRATGLFLPVGVGGAEIAMTAALIVIGMTLAVIPSIAAYRKPVSAALRS